MHLLSCVGCEGALEQESWAAVAVNHDSQHLAERAAQIKAANQERAAHHQWHRIACW